MIQRNATKRSTMKPHAAERNDTKHHYATTERNETKHHEVTTERNETKHREATTERNETKYHETTRERNETKHHVAATTDRNEAKHHDATTERNETKHREATTERNETNCLEVITEVNETCLDNPPIATPEIPVSQEQIPTPTVVSNFDNLRTISKKIPELIPDVDVGVLIGSNCLLALEPLEVLPSGGIGPFAMRLLKTWVDVSCDLHVRARLWNNDHSSTSDDSSLSQEDREFLSIADQGIRRVDGHYELPLPFRDPDVVMSNNREQAEKRADWQRKKMLREDEL
ncbi:hypothetical protein QZH41_016734, partial [Actinostola sp. cb2023]